MVRNHSPYNLQYVKIKILYNIHDVRIMIIIMSDSQKLDYCLGVFIIFSLVFLCHPSDDV